jgi:Sigma-70 region 2
VSADKTGELEGLLARAREGDSRSVGVIFARYRGLVEGVCAGRLGRSDLLADAVQEVFLKLMLSIRRIREPYWSVKLNSCLIACAPGGVGLGWCRSGS